MRILLIDDINSDLETLILNALKLDGIQTKTLDVARTSEEKIRMYAARSPYHLVLINVLHSEINSTEIARTISRLNPYQMIARRPLP